MEKLYKVELKGIGEIIADAGTLDNLTYLLDQAYNYCEDMHDKALKADDIYMLPMLYKEDMANIHESKAHIIEILQEETL